MSDILQLEFTKTEIFSISEEIKMSDICAYSEIIIKNETVILIIL